MFCHISWLQSLYFVSLIFGGHLIDSLDVWTLTLVLLFFFLPLPFLLCPLWLIIDEHKCLYFFVWPFYVVCSSKACFCCSFTVHWLLFYRNEKEISFLIVANDYGIHASLPLDPGLGSSSVLTDMLSTDWLSLEGLCMGTLAPAPLLILTAVLLLVLVLCFWYRVLLCDLRDL